MVRHPEEKKEEHLEFSCTGVGANTCTASNESFLEKKPDDDRNAASRLGAARTSEAVPCVARHEEEKKEERRDSSFTGVGAKTLLKKKPDDDRNAASRLGTASTSEEEPDEARHQGEKKEEDPESICTSVTSVGAQTCKASNRSFLHRCKASNKSFLKKKKTPDDDRNAASRLRAASVSEEKPDEARLEEEKKEEDPESSYTGVGSSRCKASNKSFLHRCKSSNKSFLKKKKTPDDDRNAASRLRAASVSEEKPDEARLEEEKKEEDPESMESSYTGVGANTCTARNKSCLKKKPDDDRIGGVTVSEEEPDEARLEEEKKEEHPELDQQEMTQAGVVKPTIMPKFDVLDFVSQHVEAFLWRDERANEVDPDLKQFGIDESSPIKLHHMTSKSEQKQGMLDDACNGVKGLVCREGGDANAESQQEDLEAGILTKVRMNMLREHSLLDLDFSLDTQPTESSSDDDNTNIRRLQELRRKKRTIESRIYSSSTKPGILVPMGHAGKSATPKAKLELAAEMRAEKVMKEQRKKKLMALVIVASFLAALLVVGISLFLSPTL